MRDKLKKLLKLIVDTFVRMLIHKPKLTLVMVFIPLFVLFYKSETTVKFQDAMIADYHLKQEAKAKVIKKVPNNLVKVPDTYFKTKEHVQALFSHAGLKVEFVPKNFDDAAKINERNIYTDDSYQIESQPNIQYLDSDEYGDNYGYYAQKGSTIVVGYTDHDYFYKDDKTDEKSLSSQSSSASSSTTATTTPIVLTINEFITKYDNSELDTNLTYQFDAELARQEDWGLDADGIEYSIFIKDGKPAGFIMFTKEHIANTIKNSKTVTFTVKIDSSSTTYIDPVRVVSATPTNTGTSTTASSSETLDLNDYAIFLQDTINDFVAEYRVTVYQKEGGAMHVVFPQDIKYESTANLQAFSDAMLEVHRSAFYLWSAEKNFSTTNSGTDIPIVYMDAEDGTRIAEYSVLSGKMKVKIKN